MISTRIIVACTCLFIVSSSTSAQDSAQYGVKGDARTGSIIRRQEIKSNGVPINRSWQRLKPEEQAIVRGWYQNMPAADEPPFPEDGLKAIHEAILRGKEKRGVTGELDLAATVEANGKVSSVKAYKSPDAEMTQYVGTVVMLTRFKPAVCSGKPCRMDFPVTYKFDVDPLKESLIPRRGGVAPGE